MTGIVVAGMHRSGTSLMTRFLVEGGWHPGERLLRLDDEEYLEDRRFVGIHQAWLPGPSPDHDSHPDWGVVGGRLIETQPADEAEAGARRDAVSAFAEQRDAERTRWVAKDPRATLFLEHWAELPDVRFVFLYRAPWDVVESAVRLGRDVFCRRPRIANVAWLGYNRHLVDFARRHRTRCRIVSSDSLVTDVDRVSQLLDDFVELDHGISSSLIAPHRLRHRDDSSSMAHLYADVHPEHTSVLQELDELADLGRRTPSAPNRRRRPPVSGGDLAPDTGVQVVIPCRDDGDFLLEAVASVDECESAQIELTIVDDGSTDDETRRVLDALRRGGRHVIRTDGVGLAAARNAGCTTSRTQAVIPLDADNRLRPSLVAAIDTMQESDVQVVHGSWQCFGLDTDRVDPPSLTIASLVPVNTVDACALISRSLLDRLGGWDPHLPFWEDWDFWLRAVEQGVSSRRIDDVTFDYLVRPSSLSARATHEPSTRAAVVRRIIAAHPAAIDPDVGRLVQRVYSERLRPVALRGRRPSAVIRRLLRQRLDRRIAAALRHRT